jgi:hypothetical protein
VDNHWFFDTEIIIAAEMSGLTIQEVPCLFQRNTNKKTTVRVFRDSIEYLRALGRFKASCNQRPK